MKVKNLIEMLQGCDPNADVLIMSQPSWPFEYAIRGLTVRADFVSKDEDDDTGTSEEARESSYTDSFLTQGKPNDVFLCEGQQLRYGNSDAFSACQGSW